MFDLVLSLEDKVKIFIGMSIFITAGLAAWRSQGLSLRKALNTGISIFNKGISIFMRFTISVWRSGSLILKCQRSEGSFLPSTFQDTGTVALIIIFFGAAWAWMIFFPLNFGHRDEITYLTGPIGAQIWSGRFFPIAHWEFNILSLRFWGGHLAPLYVLPFIQSIILILCLDYLLRPAHPLIRLFTIGSALWLAAFMPMVHLIIPERNVFFLLLIGLCCMKVYATNPGPIKAFIAISALTLALYYKEPVFALILPMACVFAFYAFWEERTKGGGVIACLRKAFGPLEVSIILSCLIFLAGYVVFVYGNGAPQESYMGVSAKATLSEYAVRFWYYLWNVPILSVLILAGVGAHFLIPKGAFDRALAAGVALGGAGYLSVMVILNMPLNGYYYTPPLLAMCLSAGLVMKNTPKEVLHRAVHGFLSLVLICGIGYITYVQSPIIVTDLVQKKNFHYAYDFLEKELLKSEKIKTIYYAHGDKIYGYGDYTNFVLFRFVYKITHNNDFTFFADMGCLPLYEGNNNGQVKCIKKSYDTRENYDLLVIENDAMPLPKDLSHWRIVRHEDPYPRWDGTYGSLTLIFRSSDDI